LAEIGDGRKLFERLQALEQLSSVADLGQLVTAREKVH